MKALFGVVSLLVALAVVGLIAAQQLKTVGRTGAPAAVESGVPAVPSMSGSGTVRERALRLEDKVAADAIKAMNEAAAARSEASEK